MKAPQLIATKDGSYTLYRDDLDEHYHSIHGARTESMHVFIQQGLRYALENKQTEPLKVLEVGLGTGYNALLTALHSEKVAVEYTGIELFPVALEVHQELVAKDAFLAQHKSVYEKIYQADWNVWSPVNANYKLRKIAADIHHWDGLESFDLFFFDAFGFRAQEDMWTDAMYSKLHRLAAPGAVWVTYAAKGIVRRGMENAGWHVTRLPGPPGKREMLRAIKPV